MYWLPGQLNCRELPPACGRESDKSITKHTLTFNLKATFPVV